MKNRGQDCAEINTMGKDAALKILGKRFAHEGLGGVVVALAVELTRAGQL